MTTAFFVFDIETIPDADALSKVYFKGLIPPTEAIERYHVHAKSNFVPWTYQLPISCAIAKVGDNLCIEDIVTLKGDPDKIARDFWKGWSGYNYPQLVTFNGKCFDVPIMELMAIKFNIPVPKWFAPEANAFTSPRYRYNMSAHFDLMALVTNHGSVKFHGGLNLLSYMAQAPGKMGMDGSDVYQYWLDGRMEEIHEYCKTDVLHTYLCFLRALGVTGACTIEEQSRAIADTKHWLHSQGKRYPIYKQYLEEWESII